MSTFGTRVRELRQAKGLSQQALAGDGISPGYVSLIESGKRTPSPAAVARLAERLGVSVNDLVAQPAQEPSPAVSQAAQLEINFARLALGNGSPDEALRTLGNLHLDELDSATACDAALVLAESLEKSGHVDRAVAVLEALVERCTREESWLTFAQASSALSIMYIESGDTRRAASSAEAAVSSVEAAGLTGTEEHVQLCSVLVFALVEGGDLMYASLRAEELIEIADRTGSARARGSVYWNAATVAHERGRVAEALRLTDRASVLLTQDASSRDIPRLRLNYARIRLELPEPRPADALGHLDAADSDPALAGSTLDLGVAKTLRGRAHLQLGAIDDAAEHAAGALQLLGPSAHVERVSALLLLGDVGTAHLNLDLAKEAYGEARDVLTRMMPTRRVARLWRELADSLRNFGDHHGAITAYDEALRLVGMAPRPEISRSLTTSGRGTYSLS
jgi:transcriptional regulator with XRE-family HTH domain